MIKQIQRLLLVSCLIVAPLYAPPHESYAKNSARWTHGNNKVRRKSAECAAAINVRAKRAAPHSPKLVASRRKRTKKAQRMALKKQQLALEEMVGCDTFKIQAEMAL